MAAGVEYQLIDIFTAQAKPIGAVERPMEQIDFFRALTGEAQLELLGNLVGDGPPEAVSSEQDALLQGWVPGDIATMGSQCDDEGGLQIVHAAPTPRDPARIPRLHDQGRTLIRAFICRPNSG